MSSAGLHLSRPVYEALPWIYIACGIAALAASYLLDSRIVSVLLAAAGLFGLVGGIAVLLRRRGFREMHANEYLDPGSPGERGS